MTPVLADATTLRTLAVCLGSHPAPAASTADLTALLDAEATVAALEILYSGLRDGAFDHTNVPANIGPIAGDGWHDRNNNAAIAVSAALDEARAMLAELRGETR